jgi:hypothetical protein
MTLPLPDLLPDPTVSDEKRLGYYPIGLVQSLGSQCSMGKGRSPFLKAIFLFLLLAGCASEHANISDGPPSGGEESTVIADEQGTQPDSPTTNRTNDVMTPMTMAERARLAFPAPAPGGYDDGGTQNSYTPTTSSNTQQYQEDRQVNEDQRVQQQQQRQQTFDNRPNYH